MGELKEIKGQLFTGCPLFAGDRHSAPPALPRQSHTTHTVGQPADHTSTSVYPPGITP